MAENTGKTIALIKALGGSGGGGGGGAVEDVQVDGTSILQDGVANVPVANTTILGVVKVNAVNGITLSSTKTLITAKPTDSEIQNASDNYKVLTAYIQHKSAFYGLAKAAGDTTQSASSNTVGSYTETAKSKIQDMLGISEIIGTNEGATASKAYTSGKAFLHGGKLYKATANIGAGDAIVPGTNCTQTTLLEMIG